MNVKLLKWISNQIEKEPESFEMAGVISTNSCGTACCIAGWALVKNFSKRMHSKIDPKRVTRSKEFNSIKFDWELKASVILELDVYQANRLFFTYNWPERFHSNYNNATTKQEIAEIAIERIRHFIATNGAE